MTHAEFAAEFTQERRAFDDAVVVDAGRMEREAAYLVALDRVERIDDDLTLDIRHYRNRAGELLTTLDQVVNAILTDDLAGAEFTPKPRRDAIPEILRQFYRRRYRLMKERRAALRMAA